MNSTVESGSVGCELKLNQALKMNEVDCCSLFANMLNGFAFCKMIWDKKGRPKDFVYFEVNDAFERLTGLKKAEVLGKKATEAIPGIKEAHPELFEIYGRVASTGKEESFEMHFKPLNIWLSISVYSTKKNYFAAVFENITESKKDIERIRFLANLLDKVEQSVIATDKNNIITYWNGGAETLHGWLEAEMKGQHVSSIIPGDIAGELMPKVQSCLDAKQSWSGETNTKRKDGEIIPIMVTISPVLNDAGDFVGTVSVETDISEQKWMQEVTNEAMAKVSELVEKLQVVENLTRHDVRNKLAALNARVFLLKKKFVTNPEVSIHLNELELVSQQMFKILEFERMYVQVGAEELGPVNVENYIADAASLLSNMKDVELVNNSRGLVVLADSLLRQLFYNLMDNSIKYGEKLTKISIRYIKQENHLQLIYEDDGAGIPEPVKNSLFKQGCGKGTGYGLYLIKRICETYGWEIQETGKQGEGAQFTMTIPKFTKDGKERYKIN
jgi:PAS domain S-box-containing protein